MHQHVLGPTWVGKSTQEQRVLAEAGRTPAGLEGSWEKWDHLSEAARWAAAEPLPILEITVRDHGPGFPPEFIPHAFERFRRADTARAEGGAGLGLAIVRAIVRAHGAGVSVRNHPAGGAVVELRLPHHDVQRAGSAPVG